MKRIFLSLALLATILTLASNSADRSRRFFADLSGYQEVPTLASPAGGDFSARLTPAGTLEYELSYSGIATAVAAAHIHLGRPAINGGVGAFLCGGGDKPACPQGSGTVTGTIDPADVTGPAAQGISAGEFEKLLAALRAGATYVNVHSAAYPGGEIRGAIAGHGGGRGRNGEDD